jgi:hypothetical protein
METSPEDQAVIDETVAELGREDLRPRVTAAYHAGVALHALIAANSAMTAMNPTDNRSESDALYAAWWCTKQAQTLVNAHPDAI